MLLGALPLDPVSPESAASRSAGSPPAPGDTLENAAAPSDAEPTTIWEDSEMAANYLMGRISYEDALAAVRRRRASVVSKKAAEALESAAPRDMPASASDDPNFAAKLLLHNTWPGLMAQDPSWPSAGRSDKPGKPSEAQEGGYNPAEHPRGGDTHYPGRYSVGWGSGAAAGSSSGSGAQHDLRADNGAFQGVAEVCFRAGTPVSVEHGSEAIERIVIGQRVHCVPEVNPADPVALRKVIGTHRNEGQPLVRVGAGTLDIWTTFNHPFWIEGRGWTSAGKLHPGDLLRTREGTTVAIDEVIETGVVEPVYNLTVEGHHTFFVGSPGGERWVLAHNASAPVAKAEDLEKGVNAGPIEVKARVAKRTFRADPNAPMISADAMLIEIAGKRVDPNDVEIVQFIGRTTGTSDPALYKKFRWDPKAKELVESTYTRGTAKTPGFQLDNASLDTFTATRDNGNVKRDNGKLEFFDSPTYSPIKAPQTAILETFVLYKGKVLYEIHWEKNDANGGEFPADKRWGRQVADFPNWALKELNHAARMNTIAPKEEKDIFKPDPEYTKHNLNWLKAHPNDYKPTP
jgi:hypothetical protein